MGTKVALVVFRARERLRALAVSPHATAAGQPLAVSESDAFDAISSILGYSAPIPAGSGSVVFSPHCALTLHTHTCFRLGTPTGPNVVLDKKNPAHKSKPNNDKNVVSGKTGAGAETKPVKA